MGTVHSLTSTRSTLHAADHHQAMARAAVDGTVDDARPCLSFHQRDVIRASLPGSRVGLLRPQQAGKKVAIVGDGVNDAPALVQADLGIAIAAETDVAIETSDVVLMSSDPLDVAVALRFGKGTVRKMRQNLGWAIGYNVIALPIAAKPTAPAKATI